MENNGVNKIKKMWSVHHKKLLDRPCVYFFFNKCQFYY